MISEFNRLMYGEGYYSLGKERNTIEPLVASLLDCLADIKNVVIRLNKFHEIVNENEDLDKVFLIIIIGINSDIKNMDKQFFSLPRRLRIEWFPFTISS